MDSKLTRLAAVSLAILSLADRSSAQDFKNPGARAAYTPSVGQCPENFQLIRTTGTGGNQSLSPSEVSYIYNRRTKVLPDAWKTYLQNVQAASPNVALPEYLTSILSSQSNVSTPNLGISTSGGGYRAAIFGAGVLNALDGRNDTSVHAGLGGLLQASTYLAGLSGGSWLVTSLTQANFPTMHDVIFGTGSGGYEGWNAQVDLITPGANLTENFAYLSGIVDEITGKHEMGFPVSINDVWGRVLARHFVNGTDANDFFDASNTNHGAGILFSDLINQAAFANNEMPFPLIVADSRSHKSDMSKLHDDDNQVPLTNVVYEFNPYEMGSFDEILAAFTPTKYLGTSNSSTCVTGFDQAMFVSGSSSELFNAYNTSTNSITSSPVGPVITLLNSSIPQTGIELDVALYPNPFFSMSGNGDKPFPDSQQEYLSLVDGGENGLGIPIQPLLTHARNVDVLVAIDALNDLHNYASGNALIATANRSSLYPDTYSFPAVPQDEETFAASNLTSRPTFFGCNEEWPTPLVIYLANGAPPAGQTPVTNTSTTQFVYEDDEVQRILDQTFTMATQGIPPPSPSNGGQGGKDEQWPVCLACAVVDRARGRSGAPRSGVCNDCFQRYCWDRQSSKSTDGNKPNSGSQKSDAEASAPYHTVAAFSIAAALTALSTLLL